VRGCRTDQERALALFELVQHRVRYGWTLGEMSLPASSVLHRGVGSGLGQARLFAALLRAADIPARARYLRLHGEILHGWLRRCPDHIPHAVTEAWLGGRWLATDAYVLDPAVYRIARKALDRSGLLIGWGLHCEGNGTWDGATDSFCQWLDNGTVPGLTRSEPGLDPATARAASADGQSPGGRLLSRFSLGPRLLLAGRRVQAARQGGADTQSGESAGAKAAARPRRALQSAAS
jgi:hypothetical protein